MNVFIAFWVGIFVGSIVTGALTWYFHDRKKADAILSRTAEEVKSATQDKPA